MVRKSLVLSIAFLLLFAPFQLVAQPSKIHVSAPSKSLTWFPAHLTREKGFYRAEGLDVDFVVMKPQVALQALIAGVRGLPLRVVMTIADKPLFALMARPGVNSVEELKGKFVGISSFGASSDTLARAVLRATSSIPIAMSKFSRSVAAPTASPR